MNHRMHIKRYQTLWNRNNSYKKVYMRRKIQKQISENLIYFILFLICLLRKKELRLSVSVYVKIILAETIRVYRFWHKRVKKVSICI